MRVFCDTCSAEFVVPYWRLGSDYPCPACSRSVSVDRDHVRRYTESGYEVTYSDFIQLVTDSYYSETILPLVREWLGLERVEWDKGAGEVWFRGSDGTRYEAFRVHALIQNDATRQRQFYNNAMTLWH